MPKTFYTERDIEDLARRGVISLVVDDDVVLTDLARDKAMKLGLELVRERPPSAPERPYITRMTSPSAVQPSTEPASAPPPVAAGQKTGDELYQQVYDAASARLGSAVDPKLLETIIRRVLETLTAR